MDWAHLDWKTLERLRDAFLSGTAAQGPYWRSEGDLDNYDFTFGERIGWKWDAVLGELRGRGWTPPAGALLDWGCGSGVAGRRVLGFFGREKLNTLRVWDHSPLACDYAASRARAEFPEVGVARDSGCEEIALLVLSHVLNELSGPARSALLEVVRRSRSVIWVEPGTHAVSRELIGLREQLRGEFRVVAPCTHRAACGLLAPENARHWCHGHASPPPNIYADSDWVKFGQRAGIDLRSLPYCFLVLEREDVPAGTPLAGASRIVGEPRFFKGYATLLNCDESGVAELNLQKRADPALFKRLDRDPGIPVYRWQQAEGRISAAEQLFRKADGTVPPGEA